MNYSNGKIYAIHSYQTDNIYIGSTCQPLYKRLSKHKESYIKWIKDSKKYMSSYEIIKYDDCYIELLELCPCSSVQELRKKEGELIRVNNCVNKYIAGRTQKEWAIDNKEMIAIRNTQYYIENRDSIDSYQKHYRELNKEKNIAYLKEYRKINKERISQERKIKYKLTKQLNLETRTLYPDS